MENKIKAVIFDVGGVLQVHRKPVIIKNGTKKVSGIHEFMAKKFKLSLDSWFESIETPYAKSVEGQISRERVLSIIAKKMKVSKKILIDLFAEAYKRGFEKNKELYEIAYELKEKGYKIGILSDQWYLSQENLMKKENVKGFNPVISSCNVGVRKPNPKIYKILIKRLKLKPWEVLFIDNREWNLKAAEKLGIKTVLFKGNKSVRDSLKML